MLDLTACPDPTCQAPAEITDRFQVPSHDGSVEHIRIYCVRQHVYVLAARRVSAGS